MARYLSIFKYNLIKIYLSVSIFSVFGCYLINNQNNEQRLINNKQKYFLGYSSTAEYEKSIENGMLFYGFVIENYENNQTANHITTKWKIRDPFPYEIELGYLEIKTKLIIEGVILSDSYSKNNGFNYKCFLYIHNSGYKNGKYTEYYDNLFLEEELNNILSYFRNEFNYFD